MQSLSGLASSDALHGLAPVFLSFHSKKNQLKRNGVKPSRQKCWNEEVAHPPNVCVSGALYCPDLARKGRYHKVKSASRHVLGGQREPYQKVSSARTHHMASRLPIYLALHLLTFQLGSRHICLPSFRFLSHCWRRTSGGRLAVALCSGFQHCEAQTPLFPL